MCYTPLRAATQLQMLRFEQVMAASTSILKSDTRTSPVANVAASKLGMCESIFKPVKGRMLQVQLYMQDIKASTQDRYRPKQLDKPER